MFLWTCSSKSSQQGAILGPTASFGEDWLHMSKESGSLLICLKQYYLEIGISWNLAPPTVSDYLGKYKSQVCNNVM